MFRLPLFLAIVCSSGLWATTVDFEGFSDSTDLTSQYAELTFQNAVILTAGISLNEFECPPHSGTNVASDIGGRLSILFASPVSSVGGFSRTRPRLTEEQCRPIHDQLLRCGHTRAGFLYQANSHTSGRLGQSVESEVVYDVAI